jgi:hypothetical protein
MRPLQGPFERKGGPPGQKLNYPGPRPGPSSYKLPQGGHKPPEQEQKPAQAAERPREKTPAIISNVNCYNCSAKGHYANNCPAPLQKAQGFTVQVIQENDEEGHSGEHKVHHDKTAEEIPEDLQEEPQDENPEGDQYDPDDYLEQYHWSDIDVDKEPWALVAHVVPLEELKEDIYPQTIVAKLLPPKELLLISSQAHRKIDRVPPQPTREVWHQRAINLFLKIGNVVTDVLIDMGSTTDMMTPQFSHIATMCTLELEVQMGLSLAV